MSRFLGMTREPVFSPGKVDDDRAILELTAERLRALGHAVDVCCAADDAWPEPAGGTVVFTMAQGARALHRLQQWEARGVRIINRPEGILNCQRHRTVAAFAHTDLAFPETTLIDVAGILPEDDPSNRRQSLDTGSKAATATGDDRAAATPKEPDSNSPNSPPCSPSLGKRGEHHANRMPQSLSRERALGDGFDPNQQQYLPVWVSDAGAWVKRGDVHATEADDVVYVADAAAARQALRRFRSRGIAMAVVQQHVAGTVLKFYAVRGGFFHCVPPPGVAELPPDVLHGLDDLGRRAAHILNVEVYGGDCVVGVNGRLTLIDLNDWPSYASCRARAAGSIAAHLLTQTVGTES